MGMDPISILGLRMKPDDEPKERVGETAKHTSAVPVIESHHGYRHGSYAEAVKANV